MKGVEKGSTIYSDGLKEYCSLKDHGFIHESVSHLTEYVRGEVHSNGIENFWSLLKRGLKGTYVAVEPFHLQRYVDEQVFRYNNRATKDNPLNDEDRFMLAASQIVGKRLTYKELTGRRNSGLGYPFGPDARSADSGKRLPLPFLLRIQLSLDFTVRHLH